MESEYEDITHLINEARQKWDNERILSELKLLKNDGVKIVFENTPYPESYTPSHESLKIFNNNGRGAVILNIFLAKKDVLRFKRYQEDQKKNLDFIDFLRSGINGVSTDR